MSPRLAASTFAVGAVLPGQNPRVANVARLAGTLGTTSGRPVAFPPDRTVAAVYAARKPHKIRRLVCRGW